MQRDPEIPGAVWPVMLTPFRADRTIDWEGLSRLTDWYVEAGVAGLFAVCLSSEMFELEADERFALAKHVAGRAPGDVPVVATGTFGDSLPALADGTCRMSETGVASVVCLTAALATPEEGESEWRRHAEELLGRTGDVPLGLYECPRPHHRLLEAETLAWAASTGRFRFIKETSGQPAMTRAKIAATRGTTTRLFNADAVHLLDSLHAGAAGFCGISTNFVPELWVWLCRNFRSEPETALGLQQFLQSTEPIFSRGYPASAKRFLALRGLPIEPTCRSPHLALTREDERALATLKVQANEWRVALGIE